MSERGHAFTGVDKMNTELELALVLGASDMVDEGLGTVLGCGVEQSTG